jgi:FMN phosphatase YigB (HAD superfamily)
MFLWTKGVIAMSQRSQLIRLKRTGREREPLWAYRYRVCGRDSKRVQRGGFPSEQDAAEALERELERLRREQRVSRSLTVAELVEAYLEQHDVDPVTIEELRWLLGKASLSSATDRSASCTRRRSPPGGSHSRPATDLTPPRRRSRCSLVRSSGG